MDQTLTQSLVKLVNNEQDDCDLHIESLLFAYRTRKNDCTIHTPFYVIFSREAKLPIELQIPCRTGSSKEDNASHDTAEIEETVLQMKDIHSQVKAKVNDNTEKAQERQKKHYDRKHKPVEFQIGDKVLIRNSRDDARKGVKLSLSWTGPYDIIECFPKRHRLCDDKNKPL